MQRARARNVSERVAAHVAVVGGIGQLADADAIENNPHHAREPRSALPHLNPSLVSSPPESKLYSTCTSAARRRRFCRLDRPAYNLWFTHMATEPIEKLPRNEGETQAVPAGGSASD